MTLPTKPFSGGDKNRQPKGIRTGGQFAANQHAEPDISLGGAQLPGRPKRPEPQKPGRPYFDPTEEGDIREEDWPTQDGDGNHEPLMLPDDDNDRPFPDRAQPEEPAKKPYFEPTDWDDFDQTKWSTQDGDGNHEPFELPDDDKD